MRTAAAGVRVIGLGNRDRGDDAAGLLVVQGIDPAPGISLHAVPGEPDALIDLWRGTAAVVLVDAARAGPVAAGTLHRFDAVRAPLPDGVARGPGHAIGLGEVIELARVLGRLPARVVVYAVAGRHFALGAPVSPEVEAALPAARALVAAEARRLVAGRPASAGGW